MKKHAIELLMPAALLGLAVTAPGFAAERLGKVSIELPRETVQLMPGPGLETATKNCTACHSADYIYMQPPLSKEQWRGSITKMKKVFGAPINEADIDTLVNYLMSQNGKPE